MITRKSKGMGGFGVLMALMAGFQVEAGPVAPSNWPIGHIAMGGITVSSQGVMAGDDEEWDPVNNKNNPATPYYTANRRTNTFPNAQLESVVIYGSANGSGLSPQNKNASQVYKVAGLLSQAAGTSNEKWKVVPVLVVYTNSVSDHIGKGVCSTCMGWAFTTDTMTQYFALLKGDLDQLVDGSKNYPLLPAPSIIVNPDFLLTLFQKATVSPVGQVDQSGSSAGSILPDPNQYSGLSIADATTFLMNDYNEKCNLGQTPNWSGASKNNICVNDAINAAIPDADKSSVPSFVNDLGGYIQGVNWFVRKYSPVGATVGIQANMYATYCKAKGSCANDQLWPHYLSRSNVGLAYSDIGTMAQRVSAYLKGLGLFSGDNGADFIVFDKYGINGLSPRGNSFNAGYLSNQDDMSFLVKFIGGVTSSLNVPAMWWQLAGGHIETGALPKVFDAYNKYAMSTEAQYVFGDEGLQKGLSNELALISMPSSYNALGVNLGEFLKSKVNPALTWSSHIDDLRAANIFAILWGAATCSTSLGPVPAPVSNQMEATACGDQLDTIIPRPRSESPADVTATYDQFFTLQGNSPDPIYGRQWLQNKVNLYYEGLLVGN
jgi:hypothetical protein